MQNSPCFSIKDYPNYRKKKREEMGLTEEEFYAKQFEINGDIPKPFMMTCTSAPPLSPSPYRSRLSRTRHGPAHSGPQSHGPLGTSERFDGFRGGEGNLPAFVEALALLCLTKSFVFFLCVCVSVRPFNLKKCICIKGFYFI